MTANPAPRPRSRALSRELLDEREGFASWEAHVVDEHRNGAVLRWGFGHPEARTGDEPAREAPSLSLLIYAGGAPAFWLHQRYPEDRARWGAPAGLWRFGESQIEALTDLKAQVVIARLDCALPGSRDRLTGTLDLGAPPRRSEPDGDDALDWTPLTGPGQGRALLQVGDKHHFHLIGRAYHHRHGQTERGAVLATGFAAFEHEQRSYRLRYDDDGGLAATGVIIDSEGRSNVRELTAELELEGDRWRRLVLRDEEGGWLDVEIGEPVHERGAGRHLPTKSRAPMAIPAPGVLTVVEPRPSASVTRAARRFVHHEESRNPFAVRLETGAARDRWRRLLRR